nr:MAG TPA: hypothetical protein [Caudoviricetes sp.]
MKSILNSAMDLYAQMLTMSAIVKNAQNAPRMTVCSRYGAALNGISKYEIKALEEIQNLRFHAGSLNRKMAVYTIISGEIIEFPIIRAIPLEHTCPPECYRIHLTTEDKEGETI